MTSPEISVIIPAYNVEKYLRQCLDGVVNQTYENMEIICVNDASTDNTLAILNEYAQKDGRIVVYDKKVNEGVEQARKTALERSSGKYVIMLDSDDWIELNMLEKMQKEAVAQNCDMVCCGYFEEYGGKTTSIETPKFPQNKIERIRLILFGWRVNEETGTRVKEFQPPYIAVWNKLVKREIYEKIIFKYDYAGDSLTNCQTSYYCEKICGVSDNLYHYRIRENSITTGAALNMEKQIRRYREIKGNNNAAILFCQEKLGEDFRALERDFKIKIIEVELMNPNKSVIVQEFEILLNFIRETPKEGIKEAADYIEGRVKLNIEKIRNTQEEYLALGFTDILSRVQKIANGG